MRDIIGSGSHAVRLADVDEAVFVAARRSSFSRLAASGLTSHRARIADFAHVSLVVRLPGKAAQDSQHYP
jgi:hypothetical protein